MKYLSLSLATLLSLTTAAPTYLPLSARFPTGPNIITPSVISQYSVSTGAIDYSTDTGLVGKTGDGKDITTLITFSIPSGLTDKTCSLHFTLDPNDPNTTVEGSGKIDVHSSLKPAPPYDVSAWGPPGNQRNQHLGRLQVIDGGGGDDSGRVPKNS